MTRAWALAFLLCSLLSTRTPPPADPETRSSGRQVAHSSLGFQTIWEKKLGKMTCSADLLRLFGIRLSKDWTSKPFIADHSSRQACRRNQATCCNAEELNSVGAHLMQNKKRLRNAIEPIEELLSLFVGKAHEHFFHVYPLRKVRDSQCGGAFQVLGGKGAGLFYSPTFRDKMRKELQRLFAEFGLYVKRLLRFSNNFICSVCNPWEKEYFSLEPAKLKIVQSEATCLGLLDILEFEVRLARVFKQFVEPMVRTIKCFKKGQLTPELRPSMVELGALDAEMFSCFKNAAGDNPSCAAVCQRNVFDLELPLGILESTRRVLSPLFQFFTHTPYSEFSRTTKRGSQGSKEAEKVVFFPSDPSLREQIAAVEWAVSPAGLSLFANHLSRKMFRRRRRGEAEL